MKLSSLFIRSAQLVMNHSKFRITRNVHVFTKIDKLRRNQVKQLELHTHYRERQRGELETITANAHHILAQSFVKGLADVTAEMVNPNVESGTRAKKDSRSAIKGFCFFCNVLKFKNSSNCFVFSDALCTNSAHNRIAFTAHIRQTAADVLTETRKLKEASRGRNKT